MMRPARPVSTKCAPRLARPEATARSPTKAEGRQDAPARGLVNLGNTCFLNSLLQCLAHSPAVQSALPPPSRCTGPVSKSLSEAIRAMWERSTEPYKPSNVLQALSKKDRRFSGGRQHDAQEALAALLEGLREELGEASKKPYQELSGKGTELQQANEAWEHHRSRNDSPLDGSFSLQLQSTVTCRHCGHRSHCFDPAMDLAAPIPEKARPPTIEDCLAELFSTEELPVSVGYKCEACKHTVSAEKSLSLFRWPKELVVTLKRFSVSSFGLSMSKDTTQVAISPSISLTRFCSQAALEAFGEPPEYELSAIASHSGTMSFGHYVADAKPCRDSGFFRYDDSTISPSSLPPSSSEAYLIFFRRRE